MRVMDFTMLQRWPSEESRLTAVIRPFTYDVIKYIMYITCIIYHFHLLITGVDTHFIFIFFPYLYDECARD